MLTNILSDEGPLSRGDRSADRAKAGRTGAPRNGRWAGGQRWSAGRCRALRHWARAAGVISCARRSDLRLKGASQASWRLPPLHRLAWVSRGTGKPRTHCAARMRKPGSSNRRRNLPRRGFVPQPEIITELMCCCGSCGQWGAFAPAKHVRPTFASNPRRGCSATIWLRPHRLKLSDERNQAAGRANMPHRHRPHSQ